MSARERVINYYQKQLGMVPEWIELLSNYSPETLLGLIQFREGFMNPPTPALPTKVKHLLIMVLDAAIGNAAGGSVHARQVVEQGGSAKEVAEALTLTMMVCGVPTFELAGKEILKAAETKEKQIKT
jgi:alkylhydroperoxidase/carboxymuconolactone decarboxylase family protein YurZ